MLICFLPEFSETTMTDIQRHSSLDDANSDISSNVDYGSPNAAEGEQESDAKADDEDTGPDIDEDEEDLDTDERELPEQLEINNGHDQMNKEDHDLENNDLIKNNDSQQQSAIKISDKSNKRSNGDMGLLSPNIFNNNKSNQRKLANRLNKSLMSFSSSRNLKNNISTSGRNGCNNKQPQSTLPSNTVLMPHIGNRKRKSYPSIVSGKLNKMPTTLSNVSSTVTNPTSTVPLLMTTLPSVLTSSSPSSHVAISSSSLGSIVMPNVTDQMDLAGNTQLNSINNNQSNCFTGNGSQQNPQLTQAAFAAATAALATAAAAAGISVNQLITQVNYSFFM